MVHTSVCIGKQTCKYSKKINIWANKYFKYRVLYKVSDYYVELYINTKP